MSTAEVQYFALLRSALWDVPLSIDGPIEWKAVMQIANFHGNGVLLADLAARMDDGHRPSPKMLVKMQNDMRVNLINQLRLKQHLCRVVKLLREQGIEPVLLKGFGLARLYPNPSLRRFGDIDLFVGLEHFHKACAILRALPDAYTWCIEEDVGRHYNVEFGDIVFEIHRVSADVVDAKEHEVYAAIEQDGLKEHPQRVDLDGFEILVPSKEFIVFFTFYHAWHHFLTTGVGWRQLSDVAVALHACHGQLDLDKLHQWFASMNLMTPWKTFGYLMVDRLGLPEEEMPFYDSSCKRKAERLYRKIMKDGNFNRANKFRLKKPKKRFWHKVHAFICVFVDFFRRVGVFPSQAFREFCTSLKAGIRKNIKN